MQWRRPGVEFGGTENFFDGPKISEGRNFVEKFPFSRLKFLMTFFFFSHRPDLSDFPFLFSDFPYLCYVYCLMSYLTLSSQEKHPFLLCSYFRAHPTTLLL